jgi:hypothetical protein
VWIACVVVVLADAGCATLTVPWAQPDYQAIAESISLSAAELSPFSVHPPVAGVPGAAASGWTLVNDEAIDVDGLKRGCLPVNYSDTAGWFRSYSYDLEPNDSEEGQGLSYVYVIGTASHAAAEQNAVASAAYGSCYGEEDTEQVSGLGGSVVTGPVSDTAESVDAGVPSLMRLYSFPYTYAGMALTWYDSVIWLQYARYRAILDLSTCCGQPPAGDFQPDAQLLAKRMRAAPA